MKDSRRTPPKAEESASAPDAYTQYKKDRYQAYILRTNSLSDLAFKTSERYDHWVLTLSGGALAVSLTFLEKIAPQPGPATLWFLAFSWLAYIISLLTGFCAIYYSREALYGERDKCEVAYAHFVRTTTEANPEGEPHQDAKNTASEYVKWLSGTSTLLLIIGTLLLCAFALLNIPTAKRVPQSQIQPQVNAVASPSGTNTVLQTPQTTTPLSTNKASTNSSTPYQTP